MKGSHSLKKPSLSLAMIKVKRKKLLSKKSPKNLNYRLLCQDPSKIY
jgi:hypothetical protein